MPTIEMMLCVQNGAVFEAGAAVSSRMGIAYGPVQVYVREKPASYESKCLQMCNEMLANLEGEVDQLATTNQALFQDSSFGSKLWLDRTSWAAAAKGLSTAFKHEPNEIARLTEL